MTGLADALLDSVPLVAITGQVRSLRLLTRAAAAGASTRLLRVRNCWCSALLPRALACLNTGQVCNSTCAGAPQADWL